MANATLHPRHLCQFPSFASLLVDKVDHAILIILCYSVSGNRVTSASNIILIWFSLQQTCI